MSIKEGDMVSIRQDFINRYKDVLEKSLSAIQYLRIHGFSTYMESEGIVNRIMMFKDKNEMRDQKIRSI